MSGGLVIAREHTHLGEIDEQDVHGVEFGFDFPLRADETISLLCQGSELFFPFHHCSQFYLEASNDEGVLPCF